MPDNEEGRRLEEFIKLRYDMVKHTTTLTTATAVAFIALSRSATTIPVIPLLFLGISGISGLYAMPRVAALLFLEGEVRTKANREGYWAHNISATSLVVAIVYYVVRVPVYWG
jgi:hypothetical protein